MLATVHRPLHLAREALTLSELSGGRAVLGVRLGDPNDRGAALNPLWDAEMLASVRRGPLRRAQAR